MRRGRAIRLGFATLALTLPLALQAAPAHAKGNAQVTISGPGIDGSISLRGDDAFTWLGGTGVGQLKFSSPDVNGTLRPDATLGPAYSVRVSFEPGCRGALLQTLYPFATGGAQVHVAAGQRFCMQEPAGYWSASSEVMDLLFAKGLPRVAPAGADQGTRSGAIASGAETFPPAGILVGIAIVAIAVAVGAFMRRRSPDLA
jgi:hypothetical protein